MQSNTTRFINRTDALILFILGSLTFCTAFGLSSPALLLNDEWITVNQINQLVSGSNLIESEGKYGRSFEGEESAYFTKRGSYLAYSLSLPIISLPAMYGILSAGDNFRLILLVIWFILGLCSLFSCVWLMDQSDSRSGIILLWLVIIFFFALFLANLYFYQPFQTSFIDSPIESAAVILTNEILLAFMTPMIYSVFRNLSLPRKTAIIGSISVICCSSYLIWSSSAKDHLMVAFLLTIIFWLFSSKLREKSIGKWFLIFAISGLLCWVRTEYGVIIVAGLTLWILGSGLINRKLTGKTILDIVKYQLLPGFAGLFFGLIPFLINNILVTGNPFIPPQYLYIISARNTMVSVLEPSSFQLSYSPFRIFTYIQQTLSMYTPDIENVIVDVAGLLFAPANNGVGILFICPIILPALLYLLIHYSGIKMNYSPDVRLMLLFSGFIATITIVGYLRVLHGSTISSGSLPDMRYFSPVYLPLGIISVLLLSPVINGCVDRLFHYLLIALFMGVPILSILTFYYLSYYGISFEAYANLFMRILLLVLLLLFGAVAWRKEIWHEGRLFPLLLTLLIMIPALFQVFFVVVHAFSKMNGYLHWQPVLQHLFMNVIEIMV